ncbi:MAG: Lrp/AsnC family transcriptional regulator [Oscillospiraceae bacterium]
MEKLLKLLGDNARLSFEELGTMLDKTAAEVATMVDDATKSGIIKGFKTLIDWDKADVNNVKCMIDLCVTPQKDHGFDEIAQSIARLREVESVTLMSGGYDLSVVISGKSFQDIALFVARRLSPMDNVLSTATHFVLKTYKKDGVIYENEVVDERGYATI